MELGRREVGAEAIGRQVKLELAHNVRQHSFVVGKTDGNRTVPWFWRMWRRPVQAIGGASGRASTATGEQRSKDRRVTEGRLGAESLAWRRAWRRELGACEESVRQQCGGHRCCRGRRLVCG